MCKMISEQYDDYDKSQNLAVFPTQRRSAVSTRMAASQQ